MQLIISYLDHTYRFNRPVTHVACYRIDISSGLLFFQTESSARQGGLKNNLSAIMIIAYEEIKPE